MDLPAIVLAAGASRRLGRPKQLVFVGAETLLARTIRVVRESGAPHLRGEMWGTRDAFGSAAGGIFVVLGANAAAIEQGVDLAGVHVVRNELWEYGIASSIRAGLGAVCFKETRVAGVLLLVCDQPRLSAEHLRRMHAEFEEAEGGVIVASSYAGVRGIPAIFPVSQFDKLRGLDGDTGARYVLGRPECEAIDVEFDGGEMDVDTPEDLAGLHRIDG